MTALPQPALSVGHAGGKYPVYIGPGLLDQLGAIAAHHLPGRTVYLVTDDVVAGLLAQWRSDARHPWREPGTAPDMSWADEAISIPRGESAKSRAEWGRVTDALLDRGAGRDSALMALGGGVVGDLAGFVAATFMRGIPVLAVPTTLLAMVDASVGGKTAVDTPDGKNLVGAFHQPTAVVADLRCLGTLSDAEFRIGLAEAIKHGVMADRDLFDWMERRHASILERDLETVADLVRANVQVKAAVVEQDERDAGRRAHLNLGHTVAHALERATDYQLGHGEAVSLGLVAESALAADLGLAPDGLAGEVANALHTFGLPTAIGGGPVAADVIGAMRYDKKGLESRIRFSLPAGIGAMAADGPPWTVAVDDPVRIQRALARIGIG